MKSKLQAYKCLCCEWSIQTHKMYDGKSCPDCDGPIIPDEDAGNRHGK